MDSLPLSDGNRNTGFQLGVNHGPIGAIHFGSDRAEDPQQTTDNGVLRSLAFPQMLDRRDNIETCHANTCQWILGSKEYRAWRNQPHGLLWIKGKPGAGKSTLMAFLYARLKASQPEDDSRGIRLEFFFTARGTDLQRTSLGMLRSLLNQIFFQDATIRPQVRKVYEERCKQFGYGEQKWNWPQVVLEELLVAAILRSSTQQHITVFVDALDEAGADSAQKLAEYFHRLVDRAGRGKLPVKVCISCRHYPIVVTAKAVEIHVEKHNGEDIATYIRDLLTDIVDDTYTQKATDVLAAHLNERANGVFQWAHLMIPLTKRKILEGESLDDIRCWLRNVPTDLENVYVYILEKVIDAMNRDQAFLLFKWVCLAERPLTVREMRYAFASHNMRGTPTIKEGWEKVAGFGNSETMMKRKILAVSGGLAETLPINYGSDTVQVVHQSVNDFLRSKGLGLLYHLTSTGTDTVAVDGGKILSHSHATIYRSCLLYLATEFATLFKRFSDCSPLERQGLEENHPLLHYATLHLFVHAEKAAASRADILQNEQDVLQQIISGWVKICRFLRPYRFPPAGTKLIHMAAAANLPDLLEEMISGGADLMEEDADGNSAFHAAALWGHQKIGRILYENGADQMAQSHDGTTPLVEAARHGRLGFVEWLLTEKAQFETSHDERRNALQEASWEGHAGIVKLLLDAGADANSGGGRFGNVLQGAAYRGSVEVVQMLLDAHADVNAQGGEYGNALQAAVYWGKVEVVHMLLNAHADPNIQGGIFEYVLLAAAHNRDSDQIRILLDAGADSLVADELDQTFLHVHVAALTEISDVLVRSPRLAPAINRRDKLLQTPLHISINQGCSRSAIALLDMGANPSIRDAYGKTVIDWVAEDRNLVLEIHKRCPEIVITSRETQELTVRQSIFQISNTLLHSQLRDPWRLVQILGRLLLFVNDVGNAGYLFGLHISDEHHFPKNIVISCDNCGYSTKTAGRYVCRDCAEVDLCRKCAQSDWLLIHSRPLHNREHELFEVPDVYDSDDRSKGTSSERFNAFLNNLIDRYPTPDFHPVDINPSYDSVVEHLRKRRKV
ncbi:hypothetical protein N7520_000650 [Penicillium odoratum]|uniref:uncharacterized protein n=1 Tax=Penicillium odoratum TaxID=1167516 RepID=UPI002548E59D|nr:uncharacterized protein N7520_000650 [Penicillium odoratum]KAJ5777404.1 hypothetical protein N7520_000650 [Penicillium odoratum]